jgi:hypothetical protein
MLATSHTVTRLPATASDPLFLRRVFQVELRSQCRRALDAFGTLEQSRAQGVDVWTLIQTFLVSAGNVSKLLWPSRQSQMPAVRDALRAECHVSETSPLKPPRTMRDTFEHFDERLEAWALETSEPFFVDQVIAPIARAGVTGVEPQRDHLRHLDPTTWTLLFRGDVYELLPVVDALRTLNARLTTVLGPH